MRTERTNTTDYAFYVRIAAVAASSIALLLVILKLYAWFVTDASSMLASATDSLLDLFASVTNLIILRYALMPADDEHKFGHGKAESLAGLVQSAFVLGSALLLLINGVERIYTPKEIVRSEVGIWVSIVAIILTLGLVVLQKWVIKRTDSVAIGADALHYQSDLMLNLGVLAAIYLSQGMWLRADGVFTVLVGLYLMWGAGKIIWLSIHHLMDAELSPEELDRISEIVLAHRHSKGVHDLRTRRSGQVRFIQFHLELDDQLLLVNAHAIGDEIEEQLTTAFSPCEVFIHHDPTSAVNKNKASDL